MHSLKVLEDYQNSPVMVETLKIQEKMEKFKQDLTDKFNPLNFKTADVPFSLYIPPHMRLIEERNDELHYENTCRKIIKSLEYELSNLTDNPKEHEILFTTFKEIYSRLLPTEYANYEY